MKKNNNTCNLTLKDYEKAFKVNASPIFWKQKADELRFASEILWPHIEKRQKEFSKLLSSKQNINIKSLDPDVFFIYLALIGYSTEVLFKGLIIRDNPDYISNGTLSKKITNHDLLLLSEIAQISLTSYEKVFCRQATNAMINNRYPVAKKVKMTNEPLEFGGHCRIVYLELFNRLYSEIN